jgi:hypothetical protein
MEEEKNALDELLFIKKVIQDSRKIVADNGMGFIVWGVLVAIGMLFGYVRFKFLPNLQFDYIWAWVILIGAGWVFSYFNYYRKPECKVSTFAGRILGTLWFSFGISMSVVGFGGYFSGAIRGDYISSIIAITLGAAYYISSVLYEWKALKLVGLLWWVGGFAMFYIHDATQFLFMAFLIIFGQVVPGIITYRKYKAQFADVK